ncbi:aminotransferase class IV family protein [Streptomyces sp. NPDC002133]|uniref:aminotransferase class IV family protein n=1 Tax=Streptomyces sp. NPDC002133 TaxID=3154409 RepID=UPI00332073D8
MATVNGAPAVTDDLLALALTNYGHFTTMRVEDGAVRGLSLHLDRLVRDCHTVFGTELDPERVLDCVRREVGGRTGVFTVRVTIFDPALDMLHPAVKADPHVLVTTRSAGAPSPSPLTVKCLPYHRDAAAVKHVALFGQLRLRRQAQLAGFGDALFVESGGRIAEGTTWNIGFVDDAGTVVWPEADVLPGVTMRLLQAAHGPCVTRPVHSGELPSLRAAFATNASIGIRTLSAVDDVTFPVDDPVLAVLREVYAAIPPERL